MKIFTKILALCAAPATLMTVATPAQAGTDTYLGEIMMVGYNFCPRGYIGAEGQLLAINSNTALFALYGTTYGGDGRTTFGMPDLRGRTPIGQGAGPGLSTRTLGQRGGAESTILTINNLPSHNHTGRVLVENTVTADTGNPKDATIARTTSNIYSDNTPPSGATALNAGTLVINNNGGGQPAPSMDPFLVMRYCVASVGIFPPRS